MPTNDLKIKIIYNSRGKDGEPKWEFIDQHGNSINGVIDLSIISNKETCLIPMAELTIRAFIDSMEINHANE